MKRMVFYLKLYFQQKIKEFSKTISTQKVNRTIIKYRGFVDNILMMPVRFINFRFLSGKNSLFITSLLVIALLFQFFSPDHTELTAAGPEKPVPVEVREKAVPSKPAAIEHISAELKRGGTLQSLLLSSGIASHDTAGIISALSPHLDLTRLKAGQKFEIYFENKVVNRVIIPASIEKELRVERIDDDRFRAEEYLKDLTVYPMKKSFTVNSSLYGSAVDAGIPDNIIMDLIMLYSFDVDFARDIQRGDELSTVYELVYDDEGHPVDTGDILQAELRTNGVNLKIYRYVSDDGRVDYFNDQGHTIRKTLLKTPINGAYITSSYGMRVNPFSGYNTMHKGVDFGAPRGTPIKASGDGVIRYRTYNDVYGNHVRIRHVNNYETLYAHMTSFAKGISPGVRVQQGQIIGYVGSTGMSTGPHLHYEVRYSGRQVNPSTVKFPPGRTLTGKDLQLFKNQILSFNASF